MCQSLLYHLVIFHNNPCHEALLQHMQLLMDESFLQQDIQSHKIHTYIYIYYKLCQTVNWIMEKKKETGASLLVIIIRKKSIPTNRNREFCSSLNNIMVTGKTFFNGTINVWLWEGLGCWCKNSYFLCPSCNSSFKTLVETNKKNYKFVCSNISNYLPTLKKDHALSN